MAYVDTATGLEAEIVFLIGVDGLLRRCFADHDDAGEPRDEVARKLYMAMTRAAQRLVVLASQRLPARVELLFDRQAGGAVVSAPGRQPQTTRSDTATRP